jgi:multidrug resistance efflux pump
VPTFKSRTAALGHEQESTAPDPAQWRLDVIAARKRVKEAERQLEAARSTVKELKEQLQQAQMDFAELLDSDQQRLPFGNEAA